MNKVNKMQKFKDNKLGYSIFIISFLSFAFISSYPAAFTFDVFFPAIIIFLVLHVFSTITLCYNKAIKIPLLPVVLLLIRLLFFVIQATLISISTETITYEIGVTLVCVYLLVSAYNVTSEDQKEIKLMLICFSLITTVQVIISVIVAKADKDQIMAGIGMSNYAATFLLMSFCYLLFSKCKKQDYFFLCIFLIGILATQSFGAYIAVVVMLIVKFKKSLNWRKLQSWLILSLIICCFVVVYFVFRNTSFGAPIAEKIETKLGFLFSGNFNRLGSSRLSLYQFTLDNISRHWLLGPIENYNNAFPADYEWQYFKAHNFLLESLVLYGVLGTIINCILFVYIIYKGSKAVKICPSKVGIMYVVFGALVHGLVEPNFFSMHFEMFLWCLLGALFSNTVSINSIEDRQIKQEAFCLNNTNG